MVEENDVIKIVGVVAILLVVYFAWNQINQWFGKWLTTETNAGILGILVLIAVFGYLGLRSKINE
jgi:hypothetical protein